MPAAPEESDVDFHVGMVPAQQERRGRWVHTIQPSRATSIAAMSIFTMFTDGVEGTLGCRRIRVGDRCDQGAQA